MKKRLLITSIVMMLVVAVALSTATYAWFTSNTSVNASTIMMTAATNDAAALGISWTDGNYGPSITAVGPDNTNEDESARDFFKPACPAELTVGTTTSAVAFNTAFATPNASGDMVFLANGTSTPVYTWHDATHNSFFVKNLSPANSITTVRLTAAITGTDASLVRVGVFVKDGASYKLQGVIAQEESYAYTVVATDDDPVTLTGETGTYYKKYLGKYVQAIAGDATAVANGTADYVSGSTQVTTSANVGKFFTRAEAAHTPAKATYGTITGTNSVNAMESIDCVTYVDIASDLAAGGKVELVVLVWEDAVALGDAEHDATSIVALTIASV